MAKALKCESCGVAVLRERMRGLYCFDCTLEDGSLKRRKEIKKDLVEHFLRTGKSKNKGSASRLADKYLNKQPAWLKKRLVHKRRGRIEMFRR